ncbi:MAG: hypothetical protein V1711_02040 [bacterium]
MTTLILFLISCQVFGAFVGALTAVWGEIAYIHAMRLPDRQAGDGKIDAAERAHLHIIANGLRFGMSLILLASLALVIVAFTLHGTVQPAMTASYWIFILFVFLIIGLSWALSRHHISFALCSVAALTAWWLLAYITLGQLTVSFGGAIALYVVLTAIFYAVLCLIRFLALSKK